MNPIKAEIISIGNEILSGWTVNTNTHWIAEYLHGLGLPVGWMTTIADTESEIIKALKTASERAEVIVCTGGLGPTPDDITKKTISKFFDSPLIMDEKTLDHVLKLFESRHLEMPEINRNQALVPDAAHLMFNPIGTAPGLAFETEKNSYFFMPGVPREMKRMMENHIEELIKKKHSLPSLDKFILRTTGIAESRLFEILEKTLLKYDDIPISFLPKIIGVDLKLKIPIQPIEVHERALNFLKEIKPIVEKYIYTDTETDLPEIIGHLLSERNLSLAIAESFTGGLISDWITNIAGSSAYFLGTMIAYSNDAKVSGLGVKQSTLNDFGAVSEQTVKEMVMGVQRKFNANCAIASTGIAGPGGGSDEKPVGLCYIAAVYNEKLSVKKLRFGKDRLINKERGAMAGIESLRRLILNIL